MWWGDAVVIDMRRSASVDIVRPNGRLALGDGVDQFREAIDGILNGGGNQIVLNLAEVPMIDSSGIGALVRFQTALRQRGGAIKLVSPSKIAVLCMRTTGVFNLFETYEDEAAALQAFGTA